MKKYDIQELYSSSADRLFAARQSSRAVGGESNLQEKGRGPENAVRDMIQSMIGRSYRVTHGHIVRSDSRKSKQIDVIVVRDSPAATMHRSPDGGAELVRAEWVAAAGEVKSSWTRTSDVLDSYKALVTDVHDLHDDRRIGNTARFGVSSPATLVVDTVRPSTGREWVNNCYTFLIALGIGDCRDTQLDAELRQRAIAADDNAILILDKVEGGLVCLPGSVLNGRLDYGVKQTFRAERPEDLAGRRWLVITTGPEVRDNHRAGALLGLLIGDLQTHLSSWYEDYSNPSAYSAMGERLIIVKQSTWDTATVAAIRSASPADDQPTPE